MGNKELNLCEILKDRPKGTKLYTPLYEFSAGKPTISIVG